MQPRSVFLSGLLFLLLFFAAVPVLAVEVAPRITDNEIVERLTRLEEDQKNLAMRLIDMQAFNEQSFASIDQRFTNFLNVLIALYVSLIALIIALFGFIAWYRRSMLKPMIARLKRIEQDLYHDLELHHDQGSRLNRLVCVMRKMAKTDPKIANALDSSSLL
jgi:hypothetical protein